MSRSNARRTQTDEPLYRVLPPHKKPYDRVLFRTVDIFEGQVILFNGWTSKGSRWKVTKILTDMQMGRGHKRVPFVRQAGDTVFLEPMDDTRFANRRVDFNYIASSARWLLPPDYRGHFPKIVVKTIERDEAARD